MRKFLRKFFWSHGAPLGYLGSLSQKGHPEIFSKWVLINLSNLLRHPAPLVDPLLTKNLDTAGPWCVILIKETWIFWIVNPMDWREAFHHRVNVLRLRTSKSLEIWKSFSPACLMNAIFFFISEDQNGKKIWASAFEWEVRGERFSSQWFEMKRISWQRKPRCGSYLLAVSFFNLKQMKSNEREKASIRKRLQT